MDTNELLLKIIDEMKLGSLTSPNKVYASLMAFELAKLVASRVNPDVNAATYNHPSNVVRTVYKDVYDQVLASL